MGLWKKQNRPSGEVPELGAIFMCNRATKTMCFNWKTFGLPSSKSGFVRQVKAGMLLFLFEYETRKLYGVYQAWSDGEMNLSSEAFCSTGNKYPAQVHFKVLWYCKPLSEDEFRPAIKDNYFAPYKFKFGLTKNQVMKLLWLFNSRKLRDELLLEQMLPSDPSLSRGTTREEFPFRAQIEYVPENANDLELNKNLENLFVPNREVHGRLLIDGDRDIGREDIDAVRPSSNYRGELSHRDRVIQVDKMDYGYNSNNDYDLNSGAPFLSTDEKYDPDIPFFKDMPATQQLQGYDEENGTMCDGGVNADNSVDGRPLIEEDEVPNFTRYFQPIISNSRAPHPAYFDNAASEGPSSYNHDLGTSLQGCGRYSQVHLNSDFFRCSNNSINVEPLKPLSENILLPSETDNASILRQPVSYYDASQTITHPITTRHFQSGVGIESFVPDHYEDALQHSSAGGRTHDWETIVPSFCMKDISNPLDVNQDSKVCKERQPSVFSRLKPAVDAGDESKLKDSQRCINDMVNEVMDTLKGHYCQLAREFSSTTKQVDDDDNKSKIKKNHSWHSQAAKYESVAPLEMVFNLSSANEGCESQSDSQIIVEMPRLNFKRRSEVQKTRNLAEGGLNEVSSAMLADKQSKRRKLVRPTFSDKKLSNADAELGKISLKFTLSCQSYQDGSFNTDVLLPHDNAQNSSEAGKLGSGVLLAASVVDGCSSGLTGLNNLTDGSVDIGVGSDYEKREKDERVKTSTKIELGGSLNDSDVRVDAGVGGWKPELASVAEAADNRSNKSVGLDGSPQELPNDLDMNTMCFIPVA